MGTPKQRQTKSRRDKRRANFSLKKINLSKCPKCGKAVLPHHYCSSCGTYAGREVVDVLAKLSKREKKIRAKEEQAKEKQEAIARKKEGKKPLSMEELSKK